MCKQPVVFEFLDVNTNSKKFRKWENVWNIQIRFAQQLSRTVLFTVQVTPVWSQQALKGLKANWQTKFQHPSFINHSAQFLSDDTASKKQKTNAAPPPLPHTPCGRLVGQPWGHSSLSGGSSPVGPTGRPAPYCSSACTHTGRPGCCASAGSSPARHIKDIHIKSGYLKLTHIKVWKSTSAKKKYRKTLT